MYSHFLGLPNGRFSRDIGQTHIWYTLMIQEMSTVFFREISVQMAMRYTWNIEARTIAKCILQKWAMKMLIR